MDEQLVQGAAAEAAQKLSHLPRPPGLAPGATAPKFLRHPLEKQVSAWLTRELQALLLTQDVTLPLQVPLFVTFCACV